MDHGVEISTVYASNNGPGSVRYELGIGAIGMLALFSRTQGIVDTPT